MNLILIVTILVAVLIMAAVFMSLTGLFDFGVRVGQSNTFRSLPRETLVLILLAALSVAVIAFYALRRVW